MLKEEKVLSWVKHVGKGALSKTATLHCVKKLEENLEVYDKTLQSEQRTKLLLTKLNRQLLYYSSIGHCNKYILLKNVGAGMKVL